MHGYLKESRLQPNIILLYCLIIKQFWQYRFKIFALVNKSDNYAWVIK